MHVIMAWRHSKKNNYILNKQIIQNTMLLAILLYFNSLKIDQQFVQH